MQACLVDEKKNMSILLSIQSDLLYGYTWFYTVISLSSASELSSSQVTIAQPSTVSQFGSKTCILTDMWQMKKQMSVLAYYQNLIIHAQQTTLPKNLR
jgi:hypothetical protein